jgi:predicted nucleotidyltransferase
MEGPAHAAAKETELDARLERAFAEAPFPVISAYLFGSNADGRAHRDSDLDLAVLFPYDGSTSTTRGRFDARVALTSFLIGELHENQVDLVVLNDVPPTFGRHVVTAGRRVLCRDSAADRAFVRDVQLRAADIAPFLRRTRAVKLAALTK